MVSVPWLLKSDLARPDVDGRGEGFLEESICGGWRFWEAEREREWEWEREGRSWCDGAREGEIVRSIGSGPKPSNTPGWRTELSCELWPG